MKQNGLFTSENKYTQEHIIPCYACDGAFALKPASFMDYAQEIAYLAATQLGFGYDALQEHHTAWVLSRMTMEFINLPKWRDAVTLLTWHKGVNGLFFMRDFQLVGESGEALAVATSSWLVINTETRRLVRSDDVLNMIPYTTQCNEDAIAEPAPKVTMPKGAPQEHVKDHPVVYSDVDFIGHTNNARYAVWAMDCIPNEVTFSSQVKRLDINFNRECKPGEIVSINRVREDIDGLIIYYVEGTVEGKQAFIAKITF